MNFHQIGVLKSFLRNASFMYRICMIKMFVNVICFDLFFTSNPPQLRALSLILSGVSFPNLHRELLWGGSSRSALCPWVHLGCVETEPANNIKRAQKRNHCKHIVSHLLSYIHNPWILTKLFVRLHLHSISREVWKPRPLSYITYKGSKLYFLFFD